MAGRNLGYEDLPATAKDLSFRFFENLLKHHYQVGSLSDDLMRILGLIKNGEYNNLAVLLSDDNPLPSSVVQLVAFNGPGVSKIKDQITLSGSSVLKQLDECMTFYQKHINVGEVIESAYRKTVEEVPLIAYREADDDRGIYRRAIVKTKKSQTIELLNNLRDSGRIMKIGNGPSTGYKVVY